MRLEPGEIFSTHWLPTATGGVVMIVATATRGEVFTLEFEQQDAMHNQLAFAQAIAMAMQAQQS